MEVNNPFRIESVLNDLQMVRWNILPSNKKIPYHLELIQPSKALAESYGDGGYVEIVALVMAEVQGISIPEGDYIRIGFPIRTLSNALRSIGIRERRLISDNPDSNFEIVFHKMTVFMMNIRSIIRKDPSPEHLELVKKNYCNKSIIKNAAEEL